jgi:tRNA-Thr(GGU) m(6)t(6)A37 methyltransferase TsaA
MIPIKAIGTVRSGVADPRDLTDACRRGTLYDRESDVILDSHSSRMLRGLEHFSHAWIIFHLHKADRIEALTHPGPPGMKNLPRVGVLASRSQYRPNHMALRLVKLVNVGRRAVRVKGLDAVDGSPVLDIKPYVPHLDLPERPSVAEWYRGW